MQLKPKHQPYKLGRQWQELLLRFTDAPDDDVAMGQCSCLCIPSSGAHLGLGCDLPAQPGLPWQVELPLLRPGPASPPGAGSSG